MLEKIGKWIRNHIFNPYECCYTDREYEGVAVMRCCGGLTGGDKNTDYLQYKCIECPYLVLPKMEETK